MQVASLGLVYVAGVKNLLSGVSLTLDLQLELSSDCHLLPQP